MVKGFPCTGTAVLKVPETLWVFEVKTISSYFHNSLFSLSSCLKYTIEFSRGCMKHDDVITLMASGMFSRIFQDEVFGVLNNLTSAPGVLGKSQGPPLTECLPGMRPHFARWIHLRGIQKAANLTVLAGSLQRSNGAGEVFTVCPEAIKKPSLLKMTVNGSLSPCCRTLRCRRLSILRSKLTLDPRTRSFNLLSFPHPNEWKHHPRIPIWNLEFTETLGILQGRQESC
nr:uncharacterized protein LOC105875138 isoform X2 [Microcebus murinus]